MANRRDDAQWFTATLVALAVILAILVTIELTKRYF
jgi:hypothetical protein